MNIRIKNRRNLEFDLADLEVLIKDYIEEQGAIVSNHLTFLFSHLYQILLVVPDRSAHVITNMDPEKKI